jgi:hypothetical protein
VRPTHLAIIQNTDARFYVVTASAIPSPNSEFKELFIPTSKSVRASTFATPSSNRSKRQDDSEGSFGESTDDDSGLGASTDTGYESPWDDSGSGDSCIDGSLDCPGEDVDPDLDPSMPGCPDSDTDNNCVPCDESNAGDPICDNPDPGSPGIGSTGEFAPPPSSGTGNESDSSSGSSETGSSSGSGADDSGDASDSGDSSTSSSGGSGGGSSGSLTSNTSGARAFAGISWSILSSAIALICLTLTGVPFMV